VRAILAQANAQKEKIPIHATPGNSVPQDCIDTTPANAGASPAELHAESSLASALVRASMLSSLEGVSTDSAERAACSVPVQFESQPEQPESLPSQSESKVLSESPSQFPQSQVLSESPSLQSTSQQHSTLLQQPAPLQQPSQSDRGQPFLVADREKDLLIGRAESANPTVLVPEEDLNSKQLRTVNSPRDGSAKNVGVDSHWTAPRSSSSEGANRRGMHLSPQCEVGRATWTAPENEELDPMIDETFDIVREENEEEEEFEVMGGGDAVLAALIAAWLGLQNLGIALLFGFLFGCLMGSVYLSIEMHRAGILAKAIKAGLIVAAVLMVLTESCLFFYIRMLALNNATTELGSLPLILAAIAGFGGIFGSIIWSGSSRQFSKPFPFGPALALGAAVAMFWDPYGMLRLGVNFELFRAFLGHN
jgi:hypothetical protein